MTYRSGDILVKDNRQYEFLSRNPDGSLLVKPLGSLTLLNIPDYGVQKKSIKEGRVIYSGKLRG